MTNLYFDERWKGPHGIGRFAQEVSERLVLSEAKLPLKPTHPLDVAVVSSWLASHRDALLFSPGYNAPLLGFDRYAFVVHDLNHVDVPHNSGALKRLYYDHVLRPACRKAAALLTVSEFTAHRISEWANVPMARITVVGNGVSSAFHAGATPYVGSSSAPYFFAVGNRKGHKNERRIVEAFAQLEGLNDIQLVFSGNESEELRRTAETLGVGPRVRFAGRLSEDGLASHYAGAVAVVFPSLYEGFGLPVVEAMACGTPVLTSTVTSLPEVAGEAAVLVDPVSTEAIADGMQRLADDSTLRADLIARGRVQAAKFTWDETARRVRAALHAAQNH